MPDEATPDLRPFLTKLLDAIVHRIRGKHEDENCNHCRHVVEMRTTLKHAQWLAGIALTVALPLLFKSGCDAMGLRLSRVPSTSGSATKLVGTDDTKQP